MEHTAGKSASAAMRMRRSRRARWDDVDRRAFGLDPFADAGDLDARPYDLKGDSQDR
jgi:hypothetical protein